MPCDPTHGMRHLDSKLIVALTAPPHSDTTPLACEFPRQEREQHKISSLTMLSACHPSPPFSLAGTTSATTFIFQTEHCFTASMRPGTRATFTTSMRWARR